MALTQREAFKVAFLGYCADQGLSIDEAHHQIKQAIERLETEKRSDVLGGIKSLLGLGLMAPILIGAPVGAGVGYGLAQLRGINDMTPEEIITNEKIEALRRAAERAKLRTRSPMKQQRSRRPQLII